MELKNIFDSFKDFFWDIIGYFLPGLYAIILFSVCVIPTRFYHSEIFSSKPELFTFILVVMSYIFGYLIYGIGILKDRVFGKHSSSKKIEEKTKQKTEFKISKELLKKYITRNNLNVQIEDGIKVRDLRNLVMPFVTRSENKTYTFMFRSDLCKHIGNVSLLVGLGGLLNKGIFMCFGKFQVLKLEPPFLVLYGLLILFYFLFRETRNYFYSIAIKIPFSEYSSTATKDV